MNWNQFKTTNSAFWNYVLGIPCWDLSSLTNVWNAFIDAVAAATSVYAPTITVAPVTVGATPLVFTAGTDPVVLYLSGGVIISISLGGQLIESSIIFLPPAGTVTIAFTDPPNVVSVTGTFTNSAGLTVPKTLGASPYTYPNTLGRLEFVYMFGGSVNSIKINNQSIGGTMPCVIPLPSGGSFEIDYNEAPTVISQS